MNYQIINKENHQYLLLEPEGKPIQTEADAVSVYITCVEHSIDRLLISRERLGDEFFRLQTGVAGVALQKFVQYGIRAAALIDEARMKGRFKELMLESNKGKIFRSFSNYEEAEKWLLEN